MGALSPAPHEHSPFSTQRRKKKAKAKKKEKDALYKTVRKAQRFSVKGMLESKRVRAAKVIQRAIRAFNARMRLLREAERKARIQKERDLRNLRRRQMTREYW